MKVLLGFVALFFAVNAWATLFTYEGILTDGSGVPLTGSHTVTFQILYGASCKIYEETQVITPGVQGEFSVLVGSGTRMDGTGNTPDRIFAASGNVNCDAGGSMTVSGFSTRSLHIRVGGVDLSPDVTIGNIPFAINAQRLGDKAVSDFLLADPGNGVTATNLQGLFSRYTSLDSLLNAYSGNTLTAQTAVNFSGALVGDVTGAQSATNVVRIQGQNLALTTSSVGQVLRHNGTAWVNAALSFSDISGGTLPAASLPAFSGDVTSTAGSSTLTLANTGAAAGTYPKVTVDSKGRVTGGSNLLDTDIPNLSWAKITSGLPTTLGGYGITDGVKNLGNAPSIQSGTEATRPSPGTVGRIYISTDTNILYRDDGATWQSIGGGGGGGIFSLGGQTGAVQSFAIGTAGTLPTFSSTGNVHTLNIPMAMDSGVGAGLISRAQFDNFSAKLDSGSAFVGDVTGTASTTSVERIRGVSVATGTYLLGQTLRYSGGQWTNSRLTNGDIDYGFTANRMIASNATGTNIQEFSCPTGEHLSFGALGILECSSHLQTFGSLYMAGMAAPSVSAAGMGRIYFDNAANKFRISQNGGAWQDLVRSDVFVQGGNSFTYGAALGTNDNFPLIFKTNGTEQMSIETTGSAFLGSMTDGFGVGGLSMGPITYFEITGRQTSPQSSSAGALLLTNNRIGSEAAGDELGSIVFGHKRGSSGIYAKIKAEAQGSVVNNRGGGLIFYTKADGASTLTERMRITNDGRVGFDTSAPRVSLDLGNRSDALHFPTGADAQRPSSPQPGMTRYNTTGLALETYTNSGWYSVVVAEPITGRVGIGTTAPADLLHVNGDIRGACLKNIGGTVLTGSCSSDERFKKNITPFQNELDRITRLEVVTYNWRREEFPEKNWGTQKELGLIAQQVEQIMPEMVEVDRDGYRRIHFERIPLLALQAVRELYQLFLGQDRRVASLEEKSQQQAIQIEKLEKENEALRADIKMIKEKLNLSSSQ